MEDKVIALIGEYSVVEIHKDAEQVNIFDKADRNSWTDTHQLGTPCLQYFRHGYWQFPITLPPGNYELIGVSDEITEEQAAEIVEKSSDFNELTMPLYKIYNPPPGEVQAARATISFRSLLTSKGLKDRYAILKTIK